MRMVYANQIDLAQNVYVDVKCLACEEPFTLWVSRETLSDLVTANNHQIVVECRCEVCERHSAYDIYLRIGVGGGKLIRAKKV